MINYASFFKMPPGINFAKRNIFQVELPYFLLKDDSQKLGPGEKPWIIFYGTNFRHQPDLYRDENELVRRINLCLDYVRRECAECRLLYKSHPHETDETSFLNLKGFEILKEKTVAEFFVFRNYHKIKCVFSPCSNATINLFKRGLNSYDFLPVILPTMTEPRIPAIREYFKDMPAEYFISDLNQKLRPNRIDISSSIHPVLRENITRLLAENTGTVRFTITDPGALTTIIMLREVVRSISPGRRAGLILERHHRWDVMDMDQVSGYFDEVIVFPREFPSLRPRKILNKIRIARAVRKAKIQPEDVFVVIDGGFVANCFISYFRKNRKIAFILKEVIELQYGKKDPSFFVGYTTRPGILFTYKFLDPLLGVHRSMYMANPSYPSSWGRFQEALNDIYDQVYTYI